MVASFPDQVRAFLADAVLDRRQVDRFLDPAADFLGGEVRHFDYTWLRSIGPGKGTASHCDSVYMNRGTQRLFTTWVPLGDVDFTLGKEWAGAFGESVDGLPIIDEVPDMPNCHTVMGIGGNGTIYSFTAAQILSRRLKGRQDKDSDLYRFR